MRPEILNPLFAEVTALKGVGAALAKPLDRLGLSRVVDVGYCGNTVCLRLVHTVELQVDVRTVAVDVASQLIVRRTALGKSGESFCVFGVSFQ